MSNPFDQDAGPPPDFVDPEAGGLAEVIPLRRRRAGGVDGGGQQPVRSRGAHPAGRKLDPGRSEQARASSGRPRPSSRPDEDSTSSDREPDAHDVARAIVLKQLTGAPRSRAQLAETLSRRGCDPEVATEVLDRLEEVGLVDDREFAETYVRSRRTSRGLGRRALAAELRRKGVDDEVVRDAVDAVDPEDEREQAQALVAKKMRSMHGLEATVQARRLAGMLARKGYPASLAWSVIREAVSDAPEHQPD